MRTISIVLEVQDHSVTDLENWLNANFNLINYQIVTDTKKLYETDPVFKKLVKLEKKARDEKYKYINDKNVL